MRQLRQPAGATKRLQTRGCGPVVGQSGEPRSSACGVLLSLLACLPVRSALPAPVERSAHGSSAPHRVNGGHEVAGELRHARAGGDSPALRIYAKEPAAGRTEVSNIGWVVSKRAPVLALHRGCCSWL